MSQNNPSSAGFTLVEKLVALAMAGLAVVIVVMSLPSMLRNRAYVDEMKAGLTNFAVQQESHLYDHSVYAGGLDQLVALTPNPDLSLIVSEATTLGWAAVATHRSTRIRCSLFVGNAAPVGSAVNEGEIVCG